MQDPEQGAKRASSVAMLLLTALAAGLAALTNDVMVFVLCAVGSYLLLRPALGREGRWDYPNVFNLLLLALAALSLASGGVLSAIGLGGLFSAFSQLMAGAMVGGIGFLIAHGLFKEEIEARHVPPSLVAAIAFCVGLALGALWEVLEFLLDTAFSWNLQGSLTETMANLIAATVGAGTVSVISLTYMGNPRPSLFHRLLGVSSDAGLGLRKDAATSLRETIAKGEGERLEFKATLRTNLRTGEADKRMEHAVLKTMAAFLNSDGGTLLVGVGDDGEVVGVDSQHFDNLDKFYLHFTNLAGENLGKETLAFVDSRMVAVDGKSVLEVRCMRATAPVFLRSGGKEEFYVRSGASSIELLGREMLDYVSNRYHR